MKDIRCMVGLHTGRRSPGAGLLMFTCPRCKGSFWQRGDHRGALALADAAIDRGDVQKAYEIKANALGHHVEMYDGTRFTDGYPRPRDRS